MQSSHNSLLIVCVLVWALLSVSLSCVPCGGRRQYDTDILSQANNVEGSSISPQDAKSKRGLPKMEGGGVGNGGRPRKRCCPYDFDSRKCTVVDDRLLCGFNKNPGFPPQSSDVMLELKDGCRLRNGRLECGYVHPPYTNPRRPPARPGLDGADGPEPGDDEVIPPDDDDDTPGGSPYRDTLKKQDKDKKLKTPVEKESKKKKSAMANCVEVGGRIVCKEW